MAKNSSKSGITNKDIENERVRSEEHPALTSHGLKFPDYLHTENYPEYVAKERALRAEAAALVAAAVEFATTHTAEVVPTGRTWGTTTTLAQVTWVEYAGPSPEGGNITFTDSYGYTGDQVHRKAGPAGAYIAAVKKAAEKLYSPEDAVSKLFVETFAEVSKDQFSAQACIRRIESRREYLRMIGQP